MKQIAFIYSKKISYKNKRKKQLLKTGYGKKSPVRSINN
jgi:hypothetical protein